MKTPFALTGKSSCDLPHYFTNSFYPRCHFPINGNWESTGKASFRKDDFSGPGSGFPTRAIFGRVDYFWMAVIPDDYFSFPENGRNRTNMATPSGCGPYIGLKASGTS